jgi:hypothetical protein
LWYGSPPTAIVLGVAILSQRTDAADISRTEPNFLLPCDEVFEGGRIAPGYVDMIADFAIPRQPWVSEADALGADPAVPDRLSKWPEKMRMVVRSDVALSRGAFTNLRLYLFGWSEFEIEYVWDNEGTVQLRDGDLLVHVAAAPILRHPKIKKNTKLDAMLIEFYGSEEAASKVNEARRHPAAMHGFVDVIREQDHAIRRAIVVLQPFSYMGDGGTWNWLLQLLTSALNPNPGNAAYYALPGATPQEKRIYDRSWSSALDYHLAWSREFQTYLGVLYDQSVKAGMTRDQLVGAATEILNRPEYRRKIFTAHNCANEM